MPAATTGQTRKLARPFKGPYRVVATHPNGVEVRLVENPRASVLRVALNRIRRCPKEILEVQRPKTDPQLLVETTEKPAQNGSKVTNSPKTSEGVSLHSPHF